MTRSGQGTTAVPHTLDHVEATPQVNTLNAMSRSDRDMADRLAGAVGMVVMSVGGLILVGVPGPSALLGLGEGLAAQIVAGQYLVAGLLLLVGGLGRLRPLEMAGGEVLLAVGGIAFLILLFGGAGATSVAIHGAIAVTGFLATGVARVLDRSETKRLLTIAQQQRK